MKTPFCSLAIIASALGASGFAYAGSLGEAKAQKLRQSVIDEGIGMGVESSEYRRLLADYIEVQMEMEAMKLTPRQRIALKDRFNEMNRDVIEELASGREPGDVDEVKKAGNESKK